MALPSASSVRSSRLKAPPSPYAVYATRIDAHSQARSAPLSDAIAQVAELWSADAEVGQALSELFKAITALPADVTLLSLPVGRYSALCQLNPPPLILTLKSGPSEEAEACVREAIGGLVTAALGVLEPAHRVACMDRVAQDFTAAFCALPAGAFDALMQCTIGALALQERYSLVAAATFLVGFLSPFSLFSRWLAVRTPAGHPHPPRCALAPISPEQLQLLQAHLIRTHGRAIMRTVLCGFAALLSRWDERAVGEAESEMREGRQPGSGARGWVAGVVFAEDFFPSKAGQEAKERFVKTVVSWRLVKKTGGGESVYDRRVGARGLGIWVLERVVGVKVSLGACHTWHGGLDNGGQDGYCIF
ncbi:hypothetical protein B0H13DRAFT_2682226 [Mycena leptocephala]|nr:hypothetical protein B0H13DRAFT_2682226 [Mycena leptocephala]